MQIKIYYGINSKQFLEVVSSNSHFNPKSVTYKQFSEVFYDYDCNKCLDLERGIYVRGKNLLELLILSHC
jgi:hypothetical protein